MCKSCSPHIMSLESSSLMLKHSFRTGFRTEACKS
nr:MAG TPA: hypothetical protein [Caudoviricetes sp.]